MMRSLFSGVSGLKSHQTRMDVIGNNIANVNTTGFKSSRTTFADTLSQTMSAASAPEDNVGGTNAKQVGLGTGVASIDLLFTDGTAQSTGKNTDLALAGNGLFVVSNGNQQYYTRDGAFAFDADYNYVLPGSGYKVMGWVAADATGKSALQTNATPTAINLSNLQSMGATASTILTYTNNLNSAVPTITSISGGSNGTASSTDPILLNLSDGTTATETEGTYKKGESLPVTTTVTIYDSLGNSHSLPVYFTKTGANNTGSTWRVSINADSTLNTKEITESDGSTTKYTMSPVTLKFKTDGSYDSGSGTPVLTLSNGAKDQQQVTLDLTTLTQYSGSSTIKGTGDGNSAGTLSSVAADSSGTLTGTYTNGKKVSLAKVAVAQFNNAAGLEKVGSSLYESSNNSGTANIKTASDLGCTITPGALEMSNVDIANEFSDMIISERGFQSNSKIITVSDEMLETLINMKR